MCFFPNCQSFNFFSYFCRSFQNAKNFVEKQLSFFQNHQFLEILEKTQFS